MGETYTRQSSSTIVDGATIEASHFNAEFDQLLAAFAASTGHTHDGTAGEGGPVTKLLGNTLTFGAGTAGTDITITFDGETSDGVLKWMEDEDYFEFSDDILVASTEKLQFRDTAIYINSSTDGQLDLVADTEIQIAATTVDINGNVDISGTLTVGGALDFSDASITNVGSLQLDSIAGDADSNTSITFSGSDVITMATGGTTALTIDASQNVTVAGDLTVSGDDITLATNTSGHIMVADGTNFNPVAVSGDVSIASNGAVTIANNAVEQAMIADDAVGADQLASSAVVTASIVDDAVTQAKIADDAVGADQLASNAVVNASIASSAAIADSKLDTISTAGKVALSSLEIDGGTDIGAALADADLIVVDDGAGGTNRKAAMSRVATYVESGISGDITISSGTAAIGAGVIVNADINASAAIADSKLDTISTADKVSGAAIQIDGATDGTSITIVDSDKFLIDDGGTTKYVNASQINAYTSAAVALDDISTGDAAATLATSTGNITIDAQGNDTDIILKGTDGGADTTFLTIDGSAAGAATFNSDVTVGALLKMPDVTSGKILVGDGTSYEEVAVSGDVTIDSSGAVTIAASAVENSMLAGSIADSKLNTITTADKVSGAAVQIDGATDGTGITVASTDKLLVDDAGTTKYINVSQLPVTATALDDIATGDAASTLATSAGNITIDAQGNDTDIIFKGTDGGVDTTFLTIDGSDAGKLLPNNGIDLNGKELILDADADTSITADTDDQIDIRIAGADDFKFTANTFTIEAGSTIVNNGTMSSDISSTGKAAVFGF